MAGLCARIPMPPASRLTARLIDPDAADEAAKAPDTLLLVRHGGRTKAADEGVWLDTGLPVLGGRNVEQWTASRPVSHETRGPFGIRTAGDLAFAAAVFPADGDLAPIAETAYRALHAVASEIGRPHLLRVWHYFPDIHRRESREDRYQRFCAGRRRALEALALPPAALPAASLLGDATPGLLFYALLDARPGRQVENPRQISAFRYPARYSRARPAFSRAVMRPAPEGPELYISGTASIVGHASCHETATAQLDEITENLQSLLAAADADDRLPPPGLRAIAPLKVYLRRPADLPAVRTALESRLPAGHPVSYLRADVCRQELLVEIEGIANQG
jgi:chorismate lyase / 3-hydroxybenzoate synthase